MTQDGNKELTTLDLPKRFEALEREATQREADLSRIVQRVDSAASRVETLLRQVRDGGLGRFEVFLGPSGSGKTTFFKTLTKFFAGTDVREVPKSIPIMQIAEYLRVRSLDGSERQLWFLIDRDNPELTSCDFT
jgi:ATP-dependent Clp protease ATP-binding subunit ClpA